jgi:hypothetical protein
MRRKLPPLSPHTLKRGEKRPGEPPEHVAARAAYVEATALRGIVAGYSFRTLVEQLQRSPPEGVGATRQEAESAIRRAEDELRQEFASTSHRDMAASCRRLLGASRRIHHALEAVQLVVMDPKGKARMNPTAPRDIARLSLALSRNEERLSKLRGWDEPERVHVVVTNANDRVRRAIEAVDDDAMDRLAAEEVEHQMVVEKAQHIIGLLPAKGGTTQ